MVALENASTRLLALDQDKRALVTLLSSPSSPAWYQTHDRIGYIGYNQIPPTVRHLGSPFPHNQGIWLNGLFDHGRFRIAFHGGKTPVVHQEPMAFRPCQRRAGLHNAVPHRPPAQFASEDRLEPTFRF